MVNAPNMEKIAEIMAAAEKEPVIIDELRDLLDELTESEKAELEKSIKEEGVRDPLLIWKEKNAVVDGHNRYKFARRHNQPFKTIEKSFKDIEAVKEWMLRNQLGRRNLTKDRFVYYMGKLYNQQKQTTPGPKAAMEENTAKAIAKEHGVSERTVRRAGEYAAGVDVVARIKGKLEKDKMLAGQGTYTKEEVKEIAKVEAQSPAKATAMVAVLDKLKQKKAAPKPAVVAPKPEVKLYEAVFVQPDFQLPVASIQKPVLAKDAVCFVACEDEHLADAIGLLNKWGLVFDCSVVFLTDETTAGTFTKIGHAFMLLGTKGTVLGPKKGKEPASVQKVKGDVSDAMVALADTLSSGLKLDMRKGRTHKGWEK